MGMGGGEKVFERGEWREKCNYILATQTNGNRKLIRTKIPPSELSKKKLDHDPVLPAALTRWIPINAALLCFHFWMFVWNIESQNTSMSFVATLER